MGSTDALLMKISSGVGLFAGMGRSMLERVLANAERVTLAQQGLFFDEGQEGDSFYVLVVGKAVVEKKRRGRWIQLASLQPGDTFGEMTLIDDKIRSARVRATAASVALRFHGSRLRSEPEVMAVVFKNIAKLQTRRLKASNAEVAGFKASGFMDDSVMLPPLSDQDPDLKLLGP